MILATDMFVSKKHYILKPEAVGNLTVALSKKTTMVISPASTLQCSACSYEQ